MFRKYFDFFKVLYIVSAKNFIDGDFEYFRFLIFMFLDIICKFTGLNFLN